MQRDISDILDRCSISYLKATRIGSEDNKKEYEAFKLAVDELKKNHPQYDIEQWIKHFIKINSAIWQLESGLKSGKEELSNPIYLLDRRNTIPLANIGVTTILIREFNSLRIDFKNIINKLLGSGFQDLKRDHLSEDI